jgi:hypothetical protein
MSYRVRRLQRKSFTKLRIERQVFVHKSKKLILGKKGGERIMAGKSKLEELRQAVLGNKRGQEAEVTPDGQVVINSANEQEKDNFSDQGVSGAKVSKMSPHTFGL